MHVALKLPSVRGVRRCPTPDDTCWPAVSVSMRGLQAWTAGRAQCWTVGCVHPTSLTVDDTFQLSGFAGRDALRRFDAPRFSAVCCPLWRTHFDPPTLTGELAVACRDAPRCVSPGSPTKIRNHFLQPEIRKPRPACGDVVPPAASHHVAGDIEQWESQATRQDRGWCDRWCDKAPSNHRSRQSTQFWR